MFIWNCIWILTGGNILKNQTILYDNKKMYHLKKKILEKEEEEEEKQTRSLAPTRKRKHKKKDACRDY
jgi:Icc-related predicted phosphoesterase